MLVYGNSLIYIQYSKVQRMSHQHFFGKNKFVSMRIWSVIRMAQMMNKATPTFRLNRKWKKLRIVNKANVATKSIPTLNLILCEFNIITLFSVLYVIQFLMNHGTPNDSKIANELAPNEFDTPIPLSPVEEDQF